MTGGWQLGIDIGGTFTDVVAFEPATGTLRSAKARSRPDDPLASLLDGLAAVGVDWDRAADLVYGTTAITNAIVEGRLAKVALVATEGFGDTLAIGRQNRRYLYRLDLPPKAPPQVPASLRFEIAARCDRDGAVLSDPSDDEIAALAEKIAASGAEAVAVALLHAYANPELEEKIGAALREVVPQVALSHRVNPEAREYERTSTTALSAGVMPLAARHLDRLEEARPSASRLHMFHSAGGMAAPAALRDLPLGLAFSGPAAGVAAAEKIARDLGIENALSFDMGGTTTDVCLIADGHAEIGSDRSLGGRPLRQPMVAVESIGAGGGSIARMDTGALRVGPESAGAEPGPACYGLGGDLPTVTDANALLGYLDFERPVGGTIHLDRAAAEAALTPLAQNTGVSLPELARGIVQVANASMTRALRRVTVERGIDGRDCHLLAFGGAGPMHAVELARSFGISRIVVPHLSSVFSALGCVTAELRYTQQQTLRMASGHWDQARLDHLREGIARELKTRFETAGAQAPPAKEVAALRYSGQSYAVEIQAPALDDSEALGRQFKERHEALYGFATEEPWELVALRVSLSAPRAAPPEPQVAAAGAPAPYREAPCWFEGSESVATPRYDRERLGAGARIAGPAIVEDAWSTVVLPPGAALEVDGASHLHIEVGDAS